MKEQRAALLEIALRAIQQHLERDEYTEAGDVVLQALARVEQLDAPAEARCKSCGGNDADMPCAYPGEGKPGCLRDARLAPTQGEPEPDEACDNCGLGHPSSNCIYKPARVEPMDFYTLAAHLPADVNWGEPITPEIARHILSAAVPAAPAGYKLVPIEPTESMVIEGFESAPDQCFSTLEDWDAFEEMSGCEQAAHKARLCYAAMLAAAPETWKVLPSSAEDAPLLPCPFCEGPPSTVVTKVIGGGIFTDEEMEGDDGLHAESYVFCHECGAQGEAISGMVSGRDECAELERQALSAWQNRNGRHRWLYDSDLERMAADFTIVPDATLDERFSDNPLVIGEPHIRFYAGAPLELKSGQRIGTLCLIDTVPRTLDALALAILGTLRDLVVSELEPQ